MLFLQLLNNELTCYLVALHPLQKLLERCFIIDFMRLRQCIAILFILNVCAIVFCYKLSCNVLCPACINPLTIGC